MSRTSKSYFEKLKDPRWQRKRLEVLESAEFSCEWCGDSESTLHVHHGYYEKGLEPWEYPDDSLHCLCEACHKAAEKARMELARKMGTLPAEWYFGVSEIAYYASELSLPEIDAVIELISRIKSDLQFRDDICKWSRCVAKLGKTIKSETENCGR